MELPVAPVGRIIKNAGAERVSEGAKKALAKALDEEGARIASEAIRLSKHQGKDINAEDINLAVNITFKNEINNIYNSKGIIIGSKNFEIDLSRNINIENSFNDLYNQSNMFENAEDIKEKIELIEEELNKDKMDISKINSSILWLKRNANWTIPSLIPIILTFLGFG